MRLAPRGNLDQRGGRRPGAKNEGRLGRLSQNGGFRLYRGEFTRPRGSVATWRGRGRVVVSIHQGSSAAHVDAPHGGWRRVSAKYEEQMAIYDWGGGFYLLKAKFFAPRGPEEHWWRRGGFVFPAYLLRLAMSANLDHRAGRRAAAANVDQMG